MAGLWVSQIVQSRVGIHVPMSQASDPIRLRFIFATTAHSGVRRNGEEEQEERSLDRLVARCESCKVPNKQPAACKVRQNANSVMCWRAMNPKRATWAVDLGGRSSTAKLA